MDESKTRRGVSYKVLRPLAFFVVGLGCLVAAPFAEATLCPSPRIKPKIRVSVEPGDVSWDYSLDEAEIKAVTDEQRGYVAGPWHRPIGLTTSEFGARYSTSFSIRKATGGYCAYLAEAEVTVGYEQTIVYINRDYPEGSCQFQVVYEHELEHVRVNHETLKAYKPKIIKALKRMIRSKGGIFVHRKEEARSAYLLAIRRSLDPVLDQINAALHSLGLFPVEGLADLLSEHGLRQSKFDTHRLQTQFEFILPIVDLRPD